MVDIGFRKVRPDKVRVRRFLKLSSDYIDNFGQEQGKGRRGDGQAGIHRLEGHQGLGAQSQAPFELRGQNHSQGDANLKPTAQK